MPATLTRADFARRVDHTLLKPEATRTQLDQLCDEAKQYGFVSVCVQPVWVEHCVRRLAGESPLVCTVAGFPLGASLAESKAFEARRAVEQGAREVDMVVHFADLIAGERQRVSDDIGGVVAATKRANPDAVVKVILETRALTEDQIALGCRCCVEGKADFVKTSTGFHAAGGATVEHVALLRKHAVRPDGTRLFVKAAGGIRDLATARAMLDAGADRLGMSTSVSIISSLTS